MDVPTPKKADLIVNISQTQPLLLLCRHCIYNTDTDSDTISENANCEIHAPDVQIVSCEVTGKNEDDGIQSKCGNR